MNSPIYAGANAGDAKVLCIVVHGRSQTQDDMMASIVTRLDVPGARYILPKSDGVGWYAARAIDPLTDECRGELKTAIAQITALIAQTKAQSPGRPILLCGFSQGACLSMEVLMHEPVTYDAAVLLTACRVGAETDNLPLAQLNGLPIYASCGDNDPWIPADAYHRMLGELTRAGARISTDMFPGRPHEITDTEINVVAGMLQALATGRPVLDKGAT